MLHLKKSTINLIISSLNSDKSAGPNSLPTKILKLLKNDIYTHLADIFNLSFSSGVFPSILKIAKVILVHKKESKQFAQIIGQSLYYPILIK